MEGRARNCSMCSACGCWGAGRRRFMSCLLPAGCCSSCLHSPSSVSDHVATPVVADHNSPSHQPSSSTPLVPTISPLGSPHATEVHAPISPPRSTQEHDVPDLVALQQQIPDLTIEQLETLIRAIQEEIKHLNSDHTASSSHRISQRLGKKVEKYEENKQICTSFIQSLPKELKDEVVGNGRSLVMPLLSQALGGMGSVRWLGVGFTFIAWSLSNIHETGHNSQDCMEILCLSLDLLEKTKIIWQATINNVSTSKNKELQSTLQHSIETAVRCAIFCTSSLTESWILRALKASSSKDALTTLRNELQNAVIQNIQSMELYKLQSEDAKAERQVILSISRDDLVGQRQVFEDAVGFLRAADDCLMAVLLHGMGGIGKSTQALHIFSHFQNGSAGSSYRACRVELPLNTRSDHFKLWEVQQQIIEKVSLSAAPKISNVTDGKQHLQNALQQISQHPVFLYVDNVLEHSALTELLPQASCFPPGSKLLITSRGSRTDGFSILRIPSDSYKAIEVMKLQKQEAQQLLWKNLRSDAGKHRSNGEIESLEDRVLAQCDGLPLALEVVGRYISAGSENALENVDVWRGVVESMEKAESLEGAEGGGIHSRLQFSIDNLSKSVKQAFLDVVFVQNLLPQYWYKDFDTLLWLVSSPKYMNDLCQRSLVRKVEKTGTVEMHDVLKALGRRMLEDDQADLRISGKKELTKYAHDDRALQKVVSLHDVSVQASQLQKMQRLRFLIDVQVFKHNMNIFRSLEVLDLSYWKGLKDLHVIETLTCLKVLQLEHCDRIESLPDIAKLTGLQSLRLAWCKILRVLPDGLASLTGMTQLDLSHCVSLQSIPEGIGNLQALKWLLLLGCESLQLIPQGIVKLTGLQTLLLARCYSLRVLPVGLASLTGLTQLDLRDCVSLQSIPEGIGNLQALRELLLHGCESLQLIPQGIVKLTGLRQLGLSCCKSLRALPDGLTSLTGLTALYLSYCDSLQSILEGIGNLQAVQLLELRDCKSLELIPEAVRKLTGLTSLSLQGCVRLRFLPEGISGLTGLTILELDGCKRLQALPEGISGLTGLTSLQLDGCKRLQALPESIAGLTGLTNLWLEECKALQSLPDGLSHLTRLANLDLEECESLQSIKAVTTLTALQELDLGYCSALQSIPEGLTRLAALRYINLTGCGRLTSIPEELLGFSISCNDLSLSDCKSLQSLPRSVGNFPFLEDLNLSDCSSLQSLPEAVTRLSNLTCLNLLGCKSLRCLPTGFIANSLTGLEELQLGEFAELDIRPVLEEVACSMRKLKVLQIVSSEGQDLQSLPEEMATLSCLQELSLSGCAHIQVLPQGAARSWRGLTKLDLSGCRSLKSLPEELTTMTAMSELNLSGCAGLRCLPVEIFTSLTVLKDLSLRGCRDLQLEESQCVTFLRLTHLSRLDLSKCDNDHLLHSLLQQAGLAALCSLRHLNLSGCSRLQSIPTGVASLENLSWLYLSKCEGLQSLSNLVPPGSSNHLTSLNLGGCRGLDQSWESAWETIASLRSLTSLVLSGWESMQALPHEVTSLKSLKVLNLSGCSNLESLPEGLSTLTCLECLILKDCKSLGSLPPVITRLVNLDYLRLSGCGLTSYTDELTFWMSGIDTDLETN